MDEFKYYIDEKVKEVLKEDISIDYYENIRKYLDKTLGEFENTNFS